MKTLFLITIFTVSLFAVSSVNKFHASSVILDMILKENTIYVSTAGGTVETFDILSKKHTILLKLKPLINFFDEEYDTKIYSIDINKHGDLLLLAEDAEGKRRLIFFKDKKLSSKKCKVIYKEARFVDENRILLVTLSNEVSLYNVAKKKILYTKALTSYSFSDFSLNDDLAAITGESGDVYMFDYENKKVVKVLTGANKDNVYSVDYKSGLVLTAGQDRFVGLYDLKNKKFKRLKTNFLVYACALSKDAKFSAFMSNEDSQISVIDNENLNVLAKLNGHKSTVNRIVFKSNNHLFSSADDGEILEWRY